MWPTMTMTPSSSSSTPPQQWAHSRFVARSFFRATPRVNDRGTKLVEAPLRSSLALYSSAPHPALPSHLISIAVPIASDAVLRSPSLNELVRAKGAFSAGSSSTGGRDDESSNASRFVGCSVHGDRAGDRRWACPTGGGRKGRLRAAHSKHPRKERDRPGRELRPRRQVSVPPPCEVSLHLRSC